MSGRHPNSLHAFQILVTPPCVSILVDVEEGRNVKSIPLSPGHSCLWKHVPATILFSYTELPSTCTRPFGLPLPLIESCDQKCIAGQTFLVGGYGWFLVEFVLLRAMLLTILFARPANSTSWMIRKMRELMSKWNRVCLSGLFHPLLSLVLRFFFFSYFLFT